MHEDGPCLQPPANHRMHEGASVLIRRNNSPIQTTIHTAWPRDRCVMQQRQEPRQPRHPQIQVNKPAARPPEAEADDGSRLEIAGLGPGL